MIIILYHLKRLIRKDNKIYIEHFVIIDAIDGSETYYEELNIKNCWKYLSLMIGYLIKYLKEYLIKEWIK